MKLVLVSFFLALVILNISCSESYDFSQASLGLGLKDFSCTEAWIEVQIGSNDKTADIYIKKDDEIIRTVKVADSKTLFYFDDLLPNTAYKFDAVTYEDGNEVKSNPITFTTLDTTSHSFTWQTFEFGQHSSSTLYDVAIIDENNIWAVGEIYMNDSLGNPDPICYNAIHWDGFNWEVNKITVAYNGNQTIAPLKGVFVLPSGEIIFSSGLPYLPQGNGWKLYHLWDMGVLDQNDGSVDKIWGTSLNDLYFVGNKGTIVHYQNGSWKKIESGTNANIVGISGVQINEGKYVKYCAADNLLLKIDGDNNLTSIAVEQGMFLNSVWAASNNLIYTAGDGIVLYKNNNWQKINTPDINTIYGINGQSFNDLVGLSANLSIFHFNGYSWNSIQTGINNIYLKIQIKNNIIATVGWQNDRAIITLLFRN
jgi:hypothetical protein